MATSSGTDCFAYAESPHKVRDDIGSAHRAFWQRLPRAGAFFTGAERRALADVVRAVRPLRSKPPWLRGEQAATEGGLPAAAVEAARTIAIDAHRIDPEWAARVSGELGDAAYVEIVALVAQLTAVDVFAEALGIPLEPLPDVPDDDAAPTGAVPEGCGDIGAYVPMMLANPGPNVGRALSLQPEENQTFFGLVGAMYAFADFGELVWDRPLSRPQVELVAARVSAVNECFY